MDSKMDQESKDHIFAEETEKRANRLFMYDSPESITIAKNGSMFLRNKDAYLLALKKGSLQ